MCSWIPARRGLDEVSQRASGTPLPLCRRLVCTTRLWSTPRLSAPTCHPSVDPVPGSVSVRSCFELPGRFEVSAIRHRAVRPPARTSGHSVDRLHWQSSLRLLRSCLFPVPVTYVIVDRFSVVCMFCITRWGQSYCLGAILLCVGGMAQGTRFFQFVVTDNSTPILRRKRSAAMDRMVG